MKISLSVLIRVSPGSKALSRPSLLESVPEKILKPFPCASIVSGIPSLSLSMSNKSGIVSESESKVSVRLIMKIALLTAVSDRLL